VSDPFVDTDVLIRFLTGDDPNKQAQAAAMFQRVEDGQLTIEAPVTVIADAVYVLASPRLYRLPRTQIQALLAPIVGLRSFKVASRRAVLRSLDLYAAGNLDFGDCFLVASMEQRRADVIYSYDTDFDRIPTISRRQPGNRGPQPGRTTARESIPPGTAEEACGRGGGET
jgi:predicted nucleic acid-binding protein